MGYNVCMGTMYPLTCAGKCLGEGFGGAVQEAQFEGQAVAVKALVLETAEEPEQALSLLQNELEFYKHMASLQGKSRLAFAEHSMSIPRVPFVRVCSCRQETPMQAVSHDLCSLSELCTQLYNLCNCIKGYLQGISTANPNDF